MKLKTLNDIQVLDVKGFGRERVNEIVRERVKKEAINWANDKESYEKFDHKENYWRWVFMNFHNITEEDLK